MKRKEHAICIDISKQVWRTMAKYFMVYGIPPTASLKLALKIFGQCKH